MVSERAGSSATICMARVNAVGFLEEIKAMRAAVSTFLAQSLGSKVVIAKMK